MRTLHTLAIALLLSLTTTAVMAKGQELAGAHHRYCQKHLQMNAQTLKTNFQIFDINHDGVLTKKESGLRNYSSKCFLKLDRDGNKLLSTEELKMG